jgi:hypothetical protein
MHSNPTRYSEPDRWPTPDKTRACVWRAEYTADQARRYEKQLQQRIAYLLGIAGLGK